jgi:type I restriction enzyme S subunit
MRAKGSLPKDDKWKSKYVEPEPVNTDELPELPEGWTWASAAEVVDPSADIVYGIVQPGPPLEDGVPYIRGTDIQDGVILISQLLRTSTEIAERYERASLRGGDVLLGIIRATKVAIVPDELLGANITQGTARFRPGHSITTAFLAGWLESPMAQRWLHDHYRGIDMPGLNLKDVRQVPVPVAPLAEQDAVAKAIRAAISKWRTITDASELSQRRLTHLDSAILAKAFRGELVPQDPNDEPASALLERIRAERESGITTTPTKKTRAKRTAKSSKSASR